MTARLSHSWLQPPSSQPPRTRKPCGLLTPDQIKAMLNSPVEPGKPRVAKDSNDCTRSDANGEDRVYISSSPAPLSKPPTLVAVTSRLPR
jgi:hypothetical protein